MHGVQTRGSERSRREKKKKKTRKQTANDQGKLEDKEDGKVTHGLKKHLKARLRKGNEAKLSNVGRREKAGGQPSVSVEVGKA